ncbi:MAG TPA: YciI family protein [Dokdonella sp.]|nr:YciI family protein [Dokdonella sp.]HEU4662737.1 YciI family protein [Dokdonella sp.]
MKRYLVLVMRNPGFDVGLVGAHRDFLAGLRAQRRIELSGAFGDASGGAYLLRAESLEDARAVAERDPLHRERASTVTVYEWDAS